MAAIWAGVSATPPTSRVPPFAATSFATTAGWFLKKPLLSTQPVTPGTLLVKLTSVAPEATLTTALPLATSLLTSVPTPLTVMAVTAKPVAAVSVTVTLPAGRVSGALHEPAFAVVFVVPTVNANSVPSFTPGPATLHTRSVAGGGGGGGGATLLVNVTVVPLVS